MQVLIGTIIPIVMLARSFSLVDIVTAQTAYPFILVQPVSFVIFFLSAMAESKRIPFDLPEAENELGAGYHTEYSGMRFGLFFLGEYVHMQVLGALVAVFFLGGWRGPWLPPVVWLMLGGFFMAEGLSRTGLDRQLFALAIRPAGSRPWCSPLPSMTTSWM